MVFKKLFWFLKVHFNFNFIKLKISGKTISFYLPCSVLFSSLLSWFVLCEICVHKALKFRNFPLHSYCCLLYSWCFNTCISEGFFVARLGTFLLEEGDALPDLGSAFSSLGLERNSPLLCQHQTASTTETKWTKFPSVYFVSPLIKQGNFIFKSPS